MPDPRFFESLGPITLGRLADLTGAETPAETRSIEVDAVAPLARAGRQSVSFAMKQYGEALNGTQARACFVTPAMADQVPSTCVALVVKRPQAAYAMAAAALHSPKLHDSRRELVHAESELILSDEPGRLSAFGWRGLKQLAVDGLGALAQGPSTSSPFPPGCIAPNLAH